MVSNSSSELSPEFLANMVESVGVGIGIYGEDGQYLYVNQSYAELFDASRAELNGTQLWEIVPEVDADRFDAYWESFDDGETRKAETVHSYNNREVSVATVTTQRSIEGTSYHFGTIKDISERKANEQEIERQNERLREFTSVVSHDLRNPLSVARGYLDLLKEDITRDELRLVDNALDRMDVLITELLELSQDDSDIDERTPVSIARAARDGWSNVETCNAELATPDEEPKILADAWRLQQLFENLFRNAVEHGGSDVEITIGTMSDGLYVADTGPGIPQAKRDRVFETGYTTDEQGTGFGLSIVQQIVDGHDWEIRITEAADGGARFEITDVEFEA